MLSTKGKDWSDAWMFLSALWMVNMALFIIVLWVGGYCLFELEMNWVKGPREATLIILGLSKMVISVGIVFSIVRRFGIKSV